MLGHPGGSGSAPGSGEGCGSGETMAEQIPQVQEAHCGGLRFLLHVLPLNGQQGCRKLATWGTAGAGPGSAPNSCSTQASRTFTRSWASGRKATQLIDSISHHLVDKVDSFA